MSNFTPLARRSWRGRSAQASLARSQRGLTSSRARSIASGSRERTRAEPARIQARGLCVRAVARADADMERWARFVERALVRALVLTLEFLIEFKFKNCRHEDGLVESSAVREWSSE